MSAGYKDTDHFLNSTFHPHYAGFATGVSTFLASLAYYFNTVFGIQLPVGIVLIILFFLEMYTGIKASAAEKRKFDSELFGKGWLKLLVYMIMIGCSHILSTHIPVRSFYSWKFNIPIDNRHSIRNYLAILFY